MPSMLAHSRGSRWRQPCLRTESGEGVPRRRPGCEEENEAETGGGCEDEWGVRCKEGGGQAAVMSISAAAVTLASACAAGCCLVEAMRAVACRARERFAANQFSIVKATCSLLLRRVQEGLARGGGLLRALRKGSPFVSTWHASHCGRPVTREPRPPSPFPPPAPLVSSQEYLPLIAPIVHRDQSQLD